jgi:hypothetical protein
MSPGSAPSANRMPTSFVRSATEYETTPYTKTRQKRSGSGEEQHQRGKTTVMTEASDLLAASGVVHAAIDADTLGVVHLPGASSTDIMYRNLEAVWRTFAAAGVNRLLLAQAVACRGDIERIRAAVPTANITVCRLTASLETMRRRIQLREPRHPSGHIPGPCGGAKRRTGRCAPRRLLAGERGPVRDSSRPGIVGACQVVESYWRTPMMRRELRTL